jgi:hypothetical protein
MRHRSEGAVGGILRRQTAVLALAATPVLDATRIGQRTIFQEHGQQ